MIIKNIPKNAKTVPGAAFLRVNLTYFEPVALTSLLFEIEVKDLLNNL
jgi:hypothetical protein